MHGEERVKLGTICVLLCPILSMGRDEEILFELHPMSIQDFIEKTTNNLNEVLRNRSSIFFFKY